MNGDDVNRDVQTTRTATAEVARRRLGGASLVIGALVMVAGAAVWASTGTDLDAALVEGTVGAYLDAAVEHRGALAVNLTLWMFGVGLLGLGGIQLAGTGREPGHPARDAARACYAVATTLALVSFLTWYGLIRVAGSIDVGAAEAIGWTAWNLDNVATSLIVGIGPLALAWVARDGWMPQWLSIWAGAAAITAVLTWIAIPTGGGGTYGFLIVPVGIVWSITAGVVAMRAR
jgi:hypothetical protein